MSLLSAIHVWHFDKVIYLKLSINDMYGSMCNFIGKTDEKVLLSAVHVVSDRAGKTQPCYKSELINAGSLRQKKNNVQSYDEILIDWVR